MLEQLRKTLGLRRTLLACAGALCLAAGVHAGQPESTSNWSREDAAHLLRRAAFSASPEQIDRLHALGQTAAVEYLLTGDLPPAAAPPFEPTTFKELRPNAGAVEEEAARVAATQAEAASRALKSAERAHAAAADAEKNKASAYKAAQAARASLGAKPLPLPEKTAATKPTTAPTTKPQSVKKEQTKPADPKEAAKAAEAARAIARAQAAEETARQSLAKSTAAREKAAKELAAKAAEKKTADATAAAAKRKADAAKREASIGFYREWWIDRMLRSDRQLEEKMTLFWHGLFCSGVNEVRNAPLMAAQNMLFHKHALGNYRELTLEILHDPAMLRYLNNDQNLKGRPNENLARELCELFTMGEGHGYTEKDIGEIARALTGATFKADRGKPVTYMFDPEKHDEDAKTIFGNTGPYKPDDVVDLIFARPEPAEYLARRLWQFFVYANPADEEVATIAEVLRKSKYEVKPALRVLFTMPAFYSARARFSQVKCPVEHMASSVRQLEISCTMPAQLTSLNNVMASCGQTLFQPPNVRGWPGGDSWVTVATLLTRYNAAASLADGTLQPRMNRRPPPPALPASAPVAAPAGNNAPTTGPSTAPSTQPVKPVKPPPTPPPPVFNPVAPARLFAALGPTPSSEQVVDAAVSRLLQRPLPALKRRALIEALGAAPLRLGEAETDARIVRLLALIMCTPDYQLQ